MFLSIYTLVGIIFSIGFVIFDYVNGDLIRKSNGKPDYEAIIVVFLSMAIAWPYLVWAIRESLLKKFLKKSID